MNAHGQGFRGNTIMCFCIDAGFSDEKILWRKFVSSKLIPRFIMNGRAQSREEEGQKIRRYLL